MVVLTHQKLYSETWSSCWGLETLPVWSTVGQHRGPDCAVAAPDHRSPHRAGAPADTKWQRSLKVNIMNKNIEVNSPTDSNNNYFLICICMVLLLFNPLLLSRSLFIWPVKTSFHSLTLYLISIRHRNYIHYVLHTTVFLLVNNKIK